MAGDTIGRTQALFTADTKTFDASVEMSAEQLKFLATAAEQAGAKVAQSGAKIDRTAALQERAAERARRAWQRELLQQSLAAEAQKEAAHAADMLALRLDIQARSMEAAGNAAGHSVPQFAAASGAVRVLEGGMNNNVRAAERFLSTTLGLGPVLAAAFPVVGAVAMVGVLSEMVERVDKFATDATLLSRETGTDWLSGAIGQFDGLKQAIQQADDEILNLGRDLGSMSERSQSLDVDRIRLTQGPAAAYRAEVGQRQAYVARQQKVLPLLEAEAAPLRERLDRYDRETRAVGGDPLQNQSSVMATDRSRLQVLDLQIKDVKAHIDDTLKEIGNLTLQARQADAQAKNDAARNALRNSELAARVRPPTAEEKARQEVYAYLLGRPNEQFTASRRAAATEAKVGPLAPGWSFETRGTDQLSAAQAKFRETLAQNAAIYSVARDRIGVAQGTTSEHQAAPNQAARNAEDFRQKLEALSEELKKLSENDPLAALFGGDPESEARKLSVQTQIEDLTGRYKAQQLEDDALVRSTTALGGFTDALARFREQTAGIGPVSNVFFSGLRDFNATAVEELSTPGSWRRGTHPWDQLGASFFRTASGAGLEKLEGMGISAVGRLPGAIGKLFGGMHKPTGTAGDPLYVKMAGGTVSLPGAAQFASQVASMASSPTGGFSGLASSMLTALPGFADGGAIPANMPSIVGERGPELFMPSTAGHIVPNGKYGGVTQNIHIDARGATDAAATHAAVMRGIVAAAPHLTNLARGASADDRRRYPASRRR